MLLFIVFDLCEVCVVVVMGVEFIELYMGEYVNVCIVVVWWCELVWL